MAARIESHVTVLYEVPDVAALERIAAQTPPLRLRASRAERWQDPNEPGVYIAVEDPHGDLARFRTAVLGTTDPAYRPHITILHRDSVATLAQADAAWADLRSLAPNLGFAVALLVVYEENAGAWTELARVRLGS